MFESLQRLAVLTAVAGAVACSDAVSPDYLAGTWAATKMEFRDPADAAVPPVDIIADGAGFTMTFTAGGLVQTSLTRNGNMETESGTYTLNGKSIVLNFGSGAMGGSIEKSDAGLSLFIFAGIAFDFGLGDVPAEASILLVPS